MPNLGSLLRPKKRTRDKEDPNSPTSPSKDGESNPVTPTTSHRSEVSKASPLPIPNNLRQVEESNPMLQQSPTQSQAIDVNSPTQQHHASNVHNVMNQVDGSHTPGNIQPIMAQGKPPINAEQCGIKPMADGSWPVMRDAKATKGKYHLEDFNFQRTLGTGSFGRVQLVQSKHNQRFYAIKVLKKAQVLKMKQVEHTNDERKMLARVKHPFLITLWGTFTDSRNLYMVMDFVEGGELFSLLRKSQVSALVAPLSLLRSKLTNNKEVSESRRQILRRRSVTCSRLSALLEHHLSGLETGKLTA